MATLQTSLLHIAGRGHVHVGVPDAAPIDLTKYKFADDTTYTSMPWMGHSSREELVTFESEGGDPTYKGSWDVPNLRVIREDEKVSLTLNSIDLSKSTWELAFPNGTYDATKKAYSVGMGSQTSERSLMIVMEDGASIAGLYLPRVDLSGTFPTFSTEDFTSIQLKGSVLGSTTQFVNGAALGWRWYEPITRSS